MREEFRRQQARWERTWGDLERLRKGIGEWLARRSEVDTHNQYDTQLRQVRGLLIGALDRLAETLTEVDRTAPAAQVYDACHAYDRRLAWLGRVWEFFRHKFDQRDDDAFAPLLAAADEVVWSCYRPCFPGSQRDLPVAAPLPFIEFSLAPEAFPPELVPGGLRGHDIDAEFLRTHLNRLPIGIVRMPPAQAAPWTLSLLGHEVGHHVQYGLGPDRSLVRGFQSVVGQAVRDAGGDQREARRWGGWSQELFADLFWAHAMGQWALWGLVELELRRPDVMAAARTSYPAPAVRIAFLAAAVAHLGLDPEAGLRGYSPSEARGDPDTARDLDLVPHVLEATIRPLPCICKTFTELIRFSAAEFEPGGTVAQLADRLLQRGTGTVQPGIRAPRLIACALVAAWHELIVGERERLPRPAAGEVAARALTLMLQKRERATRAGQAATAPTDDLGRDLADLLLSVDPQDLER